MSETPSCRGIIRPAQTSRAEGALRDGTGRIDIRRTLRDLLGHRALLVPGLLLLLLIGFVTLRALDGSDAPEIPPPSGVTVVLEDETWVCTGHVNIDLVKVTMRTVHGDAIHLRKDCNGYIRRIEVETWVGDGVKVNSPEPTAHDLTIAGGYIRCYARPPGSHQDGIQAMSGERITFRDLEISCGSNPNGQLFINSASGGLPTDIVCDHCVLGGGAASTLLVGHSVRSGARESLICAGRFHDIRINDAAESPVNSGNRVLPRTDERCKVGS